MTPRHHVEVTTSFRRVAGVMATMAMVAASFALPVQAAGLNAHRHNPWKTLGNETYARDQHTATLLPNHQVLLAGGYDNTITDVGKAELFNPSTGAFSVTGAMITPRDEHTATLLKDGRVLVAGGENATSVLASAEIYDPSKGTWSATGSLNTARVGHVAALLFDGTVLVAGGEDNSGKMLNSAEVYDPSTGKWTAVGNMKSARLFASAVTLNTGNVLIIGGFGQSGNGSLASCELYLPNTKGFTPTSSLNDPRAFAAAVLLNSGQVLVAGGEYGAGGGSRAYDTAEIYTANSSGHFARTGTMIAKRDYPAAALLPDGSVLLVGGAAGSLCLGTAEKFVPSSGSWQSAGSLKVGRAQAQATSLGTAGVLVTGGEPNSGAATAVAELYTK